MVDAVSAQTPAKHALARLGIERLVLSLHQLSFPAGDDDIGAGTPYTSRARDVLAWTRDLGFTGIALGPGGITSLANPSPYDGSLFSLNPAFIAYAPLVQRGLLDGPPRVDARGGERTQHAQAWKAARDIVRSVRARLRTDPSFAREAAAVDALAQNRAVAREADYEAVVGATGTDDWRAWPERPKAHTPSRDAFVVGQWILREQHALFRSWAKDAGLALYADAQVGVSHRDLFMHRALFLDGYRMGAPPSRTNPEGQPWNYPVLDPAQLGAGGAAWSFLEERYAWLLSTHDGVRLDHPHGWVCPWVYRTDDSEGPLHAVQHGARLYESPALADHPALAAFARVSAQQIDDTRPRYDDAWVKNLEPAQIEAYASQVLLLMAKARAAGVDERDLMCEVLSTCPLPLAAVLERCSLGRFRVTQKARVDVPGDVYRSDVANERDWIMAGNHDTPPLRLVVKKWLGTDEGAKRAAYLAQRLVRESEKRDAFARTLETNELAMQEALLADCFVGPAKRVIVFWADLFGEERIYNRPGVVHEENWTLRMPPDFEHAYTRALNDGRAPRLDRVLSLALAAREGAA